VGQGKGREGGRGDRGKLSLGGSPPPPPGTPALTSLLTTDDWWSDVTFVSPAGSASTSLGAP